MPRRVDGHRQRLIAASRSAVPVLGAQVHLVLLAAFVVSGHLIAADEQPQRLGRVGDRHAEVRRLRPVECTDSSGLPAFKVVSTSTSPGIRLTVARSASL